MKRSPVQQSRAKVIDMLNKQDLVSAADVGRVLAIDQKEAGRHLHKIWLGGGFGRAFSYELAQYIYYEIKEHSNEGA